jgi:hypothetical protein
MMVVGLFGEIRRLSDNPFHIGVMHKVVAFNCKMRHNYFIEIKNESVIMTKFDREFFSSLKFRVFSPDDYYGFAGVTSPVPLIAENDDYLVIIDGCYAEIYTTSGFENCDGPEVQIDDIRDL